MVSHAAIDFSQKNEQIQQMKILNFEEVMRSCKTFYNFNVTPPRDMQHIIRRVMFLSLVWPWCVLFVMNFKCSLKSN
jgi:hypothetical protein